MSIQMKITFIAIMLGAGMFALPSLSPAVTPEALNIQGQAASRITETERGTMLYEELPGGTRVLVLDIPSAPVVYGMISVKVGGRYESEQFAGISHLLEHLMFREAHEHSRVHAIRKTGGSVNAVTDMELTSYHFTVLPEHFDASMSALTALVTDPQFTEEDLDEEREIVLEELAQGLNDPRALVVAQLVKQIFPDSPMNSLVIGTKESIRAIGYDDVRDFYDAYYTPANMTVIAAGKLDAQGTMTKLKMLFDGRPSRSAPQARFVVPEPAMNMLTKKIPIKQSFFIYGFLSPGKNSDDYFAMEVFDILFASGIHSRLQRRIVKEQGYTEQIYPNWYAYSNTGIWAVFLSVDPGDMDAVSTLVVEEMKSLKNGEISSGELEEAKRALIARVKLNLDKPEDLAWFHLENLTYRNNSMTVSEYVEAIDRVSIEDIMKLGQNYCSDDATVTIEMKPARGPERLFLILKYLTTKSL